MAYERFEQDRSMSQSCLLCVNYILPHAVFFYHYHNTLVQISIATALTDCFPSLLADGLFPIAAKMSL